MIVDRNPRPEPRSMISVRTRAAAATERAWRLRRMVLAGPLVAVVSMIAAVIVTNAAGVPVRDPDHIAGKRLAGLLALVAVLFVVDIVARAGVRRARALLGAAAVGRDRAAALPHRAARRLHRRPERGRRPEHRRVRLAARLDLLHRRLGRAGARIRADGADPRVGAARPDDDGDDLPRLALRPGRRRGPRPRGHG